MASTAVDSSIKAQAEKVYKSLTDAQVSSAYSKLTGEEDYPRKSYEDTKILAQNIRDARAQLIDIAAALVKFDSGKYKDSAGNVLQLGPDFAPNIRAFDDILQFSLEITTNAITMLKSINAVLGDVQPPDGQDLKAELEQFSRILEHKAKEADGFRTKATDLQTALVSIRDKVASIANNSLPTSKDVTALESKVAENKTFINSYLVGINVLNLFNQLSYTANINQPTRGALFADLLLSTGGSNAVVGLKTAELQKNQQDLAQKRIDLAKTQSSDSVLQSLNVSFATVLSNFELFVPVVNSLASLWSTVNQDIISLDSELNASLAKNPTLSQAALSRYESDRNVSKSAIFFFETYVEQTRSA